MKKYFKTGLLVSAGIGVLAACAMTSNLHMRSEVADRIASPAWMIERQIPAAPFSLTAYERIHKRHAPANVYIEGDGLAWLSRTQISQDPTPKNPVSLHLASKDMAKNVIYLARPCQYSGMLERDTPCEPTYWTNQRYAPTVVESYNTALNEIRRRYNIKGFNLIGFSGGGTISALLAANRDDVLSFRTIAGNLDHRAHSDYHNVSYLEGSLNPRDFSGKLKYVPQIHYIGGQDQIVPPTVLHSYLQAIGESNCVGYEFIQEADHEEGWVNKWPELLANKPACRGPVKRLDIDELMDGPIRVTREIPKGK